MVWAKPTDEAVRPAETMSTTSQAGFANLTNESTSLDYIKKNSILVYSLTFLFLFAATTSPLLADPSIYYLILALVILTVAFMHQMNLMSLTENKDEQIEIIPWEHFRLSSLPMQVIGGFLFLLIYLIPVILVGTVRAIGPIPIDGFFRTLFLQIAIIGMVEALLLIIYVRVVFKGIFVFPFIFAFLHPQVGPMWVQGIVTNESILFFFSAVLFGFVFIGIFLARDVLKPLEIKDPETNEIITLSTAKSYKLFGAVAMAIFHGGINTFSIIFSANIGGVGI